MTALARVVFAPISLWFALGCVDHSGRGDRFREKLANGCRSPAECNRLVTDAKSRAQRCDPSEEEPELCNAAVEDFRIANAFTKVVVEREERQESVKRCADKTAQITNRLRRENESLTRNVESSKTDTAAAWKAYDAERVKSARARLIILGFLNGIPMSVLLEH